MVSTSRIREELWGDEPPRSASTTLQTYNQAVNTAYQAFNLSIANATVKEKRGEVYVNLGKALSPTLRVDGGVNPRKSGDDYCATIWVRKHGDQGEKFMIAATR